MSGMCFFVARLAWARMRLFALASCMEGCRPGTSMNFIFTPNTSPSISLTLLLALLPQPSSLSSMPRRLSTRVLLPVPDLPITRTVHPRSSSAAPSPSLPLLALSLASRSSLAAVSSASLKVSPMPVRVEAEDLPCSLICSVMSRRNTTWRTTWLSPLTPSRLATRSSFTRCSMTAAMSRFLSSDSSSCSSRSAVLLGWTSAEAEESAPLELPPPTGADCCCSSGCWAAGGVAAAAPEEDPPSAGLAFRSSSDSAGFCCFLGTREGTPRAGRVGRDGAGLAAGPSPAGDPCFSPGAAEAAGRLGREGPFARGGSPGKAAFERRFVMDEGFLAASPFPSSATSSSCSSSTSSESAPSSVSHSSSSSSSSTTSAWWSPASALAESKDGRSDEAFALPMRMSLNVSWVCSSAPLFEACWETPSGSSPAWLCLLRGCPVAGSSSWASSQASS
mmetsp:Transcript_7791/g.19927  ORF Transcript_7791/g.19927 Transcript_7791/m.19927 type:complete len:448 (-) Transcript_7791:292-1635(-)